jgi:protein-tyrosine-phosphatase
VGHNPDVRLDNTAIVSRPTEGNTFDVAFVCTGNRARSALSEALYRRDTFGFDTRVTSFGTLDVGDAPALEHAVDAGARLGVDLAAHTAAPLFHGALAETDLTLGFEPHHIAAAVIDGAAAPGRTFLLREFVELVEPFSGADGTARHARAEVTAAHDRRKKPSSDSARFVIPDPAGRPPDVMFATATEIDELVRRIVRGLFGRQAHT